MNHLHVIYHFVNVEKETIRQRAEELLLEQTVELPRAAVRHPFVESEILGWVEDITPHEAGGFRVTIGYPPATTAFDPAQMLNVLFGNVSLQPDVSLEDVEFPESLVEHFPGPRFGVQGIRAITGVEERPLIATALKPMGLTPEELAELCRIFARAGIDVIKDDHGLADHSFSPFEERVRRCQDAVQEVAAATGHQAIYVPNLIGTPLKIRRMIDTIHRYEVRAVMLSPMIPGLPYLVDLVQEFLKVPVLAHPSFSGSSRMAPEVVLGKLFRLYGADGVIFPHQGGRFAFTENTCRGIARRLRAPWYGLKQSMPIPAGGMKLDRIEELIQFYGMDTMLLIGGDLYLAGEQLESRARAYVERVLETVSG